MKFWGAILLLLLSAPSALAARSLIITAPKSSLIGDEDATISASASGFLDGESIYIKGAFYKDESHNYFGYTKKGDSWVKNSATSTDQLNIKIGGWDGNLIVKPDYSDTGFAGNGDYKLRVGFYYTPSGGNLSSVNWSENVLAFSLTQPTPTLTPTATPTNIPAPTSPPAATNTPKPSSTSKPTSSPTPKPTSPPPTTYLLQPTPQVLSEAAEFFATPTLLPSVALSEVEGAKEGPPPTNSPPWPAIILISLGAAGLSLSVFLFFRSRT